MKISRRQWLKIWEDRGVLGWIEIILLSRTTRVKNGKIETGVLDGWLVEPNKLNKIEIFISQPVAANYAPNERLTPTNEKIEISRVEEQLHKTQNKISQLNKTYDGAVEGDNKVETIFLLIWYLFIFGMVMGQSLSL